MQYDGWNLLELSAWSGKMVSKPSGDLPGVFDVLHGTQILIKPGDYIIRGIKGEYYPCDEVVFAETYIGAE